MRWLAALVAAFSAAAYARGGGHFSHSDPYADRQLFSALIFGGSVLGLIGTGAWQLLKFWGRHDAKDPEPPLTTLLKAGGALGACAIVLFIGGATAIGGAVVIVVFFGAMILFGRRRY